LIECAVTNDKSSRTFQLNCNLTATMQEQNSVANNATYMDIGCPAKSGFLFVFN